MKEKDKKCCFEGCNKKAEKSLGNNLTPNLNMCKEHFDLFQKHTDAREDCFKREKDEEFIKILNKIQEDCVSSDDYYLRIEEIKQKGGKNDIRR